MGSSKAELREELILRRRELPVALAEALSHTIVGRCIEAISWEDVRSLHTYVPIAKEQEISTWPLLNYIWRNHPQIQTVVPRINAAGDYQSIVVSLDTEWQTDGVRIPEPRNGRILPQDHAFGVIVVPMVGYDNQGYRLGYGKGWYDRFLTTQTQALTIGLSYEIGRVDGLPREPHDVPLDYIVIEYATIINRDH